MIVLFIKGNYNYGSKEMHQKLESSIREIVEDLGFEFVSLDSENPKDLTVIEFANNFSDVVIGFSRGTRYFGNIRNIKIGIGSNKGTFSFRNKKDLTFKGCISKECFDAHFNISKENKKKIRQILYKVKNEKIR